jgi:PAS domain-containing protein
LHLIAVLDEYGMVRFVNAALENALGQSRRIMVGSDFATCFAEPALLDKALSGARSNDFAALRFEASLLRLGQEPCRFTRPFRWPRRPAMSWWRCGRWSSRPVRIARSASESRRWRTRS